MGIIILGKVKPITEIFLRVRGELSLLNTSLSLCDKKNVILHRITLNELLKDLEASLGNIDNNIIMHKIVGNAAITILEHSQATLHNASRFLSDCLQHQL